MYIDGNALCNFHISANPVDFHRAPFYIRDYFGEYPNEEFVVELDGLESISPGAGKFLVEKALGVLDNTPILLQAGFLHYGDYECEEGMERVEELVSFYESIGFENVNNQIEDYEESVMMLANKDKIMEEDREI